MTVGNRSVKSMFRTYHFASLFNSKCRPVRYFPHVASSSHSCLERASCSRPRGYAQTGGRLDGDVADETGAPLASVVVAIRGAAERVVQTGPDGRFAFQDLPDGEYELKATLRGFAPATRDVRFTGGKATPVSIVLRVQILDEITVTAARTGQQEVLATPIAVSVLSASELQGVHMHTVADIAGRAPSVTFSQNSDYSQLTIRGIGTNVAFAGSDPSSAVYVDGVYCTAGHGRCRFPGPRTCRNPPRTSGNSTAATPLAARCT